MNVVIYARFSSHNQTEQSIEGQLKVCHEYAAAHNYNIVGEYIDRAQSGTTDNRTAFQQMIADSDHHTFEGVLVYQLDRFARNSYDSAINKAKLKKNGVRVLSAKENITDDASGILIEGVLESMAEYYSAELAQKIHRGMEINAQKCLSNGSNPGLGYKVDAERRFYVDEDEAKIVREIFERYAADETVADIIRDLNARKITTSLGKEFNKNSMHRLLRNRRYIGIYIYKGQETPGGMPQIVDNDLFDRVQSILDKNRAAPARSRGKQEYLLTTKLFCGHCKEMMTGYTGTGKHGDKYHYYICNGAKKKACDKKLVKKSLIEERVVQACSDLLTEEKVKYIADQVYAACQKDGDQLSVRRLREALKKANTAIENLWVALEEGKSAEMITERIHKRETEKQELEKQLAVEVKKQSGLEYSVILSFLEYLRALPNENDYKRKALVNIFINAIYLYDGYFTLILNAGNRSLGTENVPLDEIEVAFGGGAVNVAEGSPLVADAPPDSAYKKDAP